MLIKHTLLALSLTFTSIGQVYANIPIESRGLSQSNAGNFNTPPATTSTASNTSWDLIQQNQRLENQLRDLRGKIEEQDHQIDQLNKELTNRYTDLDQRLELSQQKIDPTDEATPEGEPEQTTPTNATPNNTQPASSPPASTDGQTANSTPGDKLCPKCTALLATIMTKMNRCPYGITKPICDRCDRTVNCFGSSQAQEFLKIMGSTQKRMFLHHPIMTVKHKLASMGVDYAKYQQAKKIDDKVKAKDKAAKGRAKERKSQK